MHGGACANTEPDARSNSEPDAGADTIADARAHAAPVHVRRARLREYPRRCVPPEQRGGPRLWLHERLDRRLFGRQK